MGEPAPFFLLSLALAEPEQSAKGLQMKINYTNDQGQKVTWEKFQEEIKEQSLCGACGQYYDETEQGSDAYHSPELCDANDEIQEMTQEQRNEKHLAMLEDFSDVIAKHFPNFDNNIEDQTWSFLVLFTEETIQQLGKAKK